MHWTRDIIAPLLRYQLYTLAQPDDYISLLKIAEEEKRIGNLLPGLLYSHNVQTIRWLSLRDTVTLEKKGIDPKLHGAYFTIPVEVIFLVFMSEC